MKKKGKKLDCFNYLPAQAEKRTVEEMKEVDVRTVDPESLVDITQITIDKSLSEKERKLEYIRQIKNPYCFRVGNIVVKCSYSEDGVTLNERFEQLVMSV